MNMAANMETLPESKKSPRGRKPIQMELVGGKPIRQRVWEQIRTHRECFQLDVIAKLAEAEKDTVNRYILCLERGGYIVKLTDAPFEQADYQLIRDTGIESPKLNSRGEPITMGLAQESIWRCLRMLGALDSKQILSHVKAADIEISLENVRRYLRALKKAGYLQVVHAAMPQRRKPEVVALIPHMNSGPRPPQIQRVGVVYDPNWNKVMHADEPEEML